MDISSIYLYTKLLNDLERLFVYFYVSAYLLYIFWLFNASWVYSWSVITERDCIWVHWVYLYPTTAIATCMGLFNLDMALRRRVSSVVEHSSTNPKVPGSIPGPVSYWGQGLWWGMFHASYSWSGPQLPKGCGCIGFLSPMHKKNPDSYSKREGGNPGNSGLSSQK